MKRVTSSVILDLKKGKIPGYQRRILLKSDGSLKGCPEDENPKTIVVLEEGELEEVFKMVETLENQKTSLYEEIHRIKCHQKHSKEITFY
jgi:hypothetical protein